MSLRGSWILAQRDKKKKEYEQQKTRELEVLKKLTDRVAALEKIGK